MNLNEIFVQDRNGQIICKKFGDHNDPVISVVMQEQLPTQDKLLCKKCNDAKIQVCGTLSFVQAQEAMKEKVKAKKDEDEEFRKRQLKMLSQFLVQIKSLQQKINKHIESIETQTKEWKKLIEKFKGEEIKINFIEDILLLHRNIPKLNKNQENMMKLNQSQFDKIDLTLKKLSAQEEIQVCFSTLRNIYREQYVQSFVQPEQSDVGLFSQYSTQNLTQIQVTCVNTQESKEWLAAIAFNFTGTTMASVSGENINIWKFYKGKMGFDQVLEGHTDYINCLLFSKHENWLASAGDDNTIRLWKRSEEGEWISSHPSKGHEQSINCIIWCKQEEQLISCGEDQYIIVWQVKYANNEIQKFQNLNKKHTDRILGIDINDNETALVSCSQDKSIILWNKAANGQWQFKNKLESDDYGCRICFISENLIARQQHSKGITDIFEIINGVINYSSNLILNEATDDHYYFPTIKNEKNNIFIQSHNRFVYILRREGKSLKQATNYIDCNDKFNYGAMTLEGDYLAIWNYETRQIKVYKLICEKQINSIIFGTSSLKFRQQLHNLSQGQVISQKPIKLIKAAFNESNQKKSQIINQKLQKLQNISEKIEKKEIDSSNDDDYIQEKKDLYKYNQVIEETFQKGIRLIDFNRTGKLMAIANEESNDDKTFVQIWSINELNQLKLLQNLKEHTRQVISIDFSSNGDLLLTCANDTTAILWNLDSDQQWRKSQIFQDHSLSVWSGKLSSSDKFIATGSKELIIWEKQQDNQEYKNIYTVDCKNFVKLLCFNEEENILVFQAEINKIRVIQYQIKQWQIQHKLELKIQQPHQVAFLNKNDFLTIQNQNQIAFWMFSEEVDGYECEALQYGFQIITSAVCERQKLLCISNKNILLIQQIIDRELQQYQIIEIMSKFVKFSKDGKIIAIISNNENKLHLFRKYSL